MVAVRPSVTSGTIEGNKYTLPDFKEDGVYALELVAVDVAGNKRAVNYNTYARMVNQLRDSNGQEILTNAQRMEDDSIYGMGIYNY